MAQAYRRVAITGASSGIGRGLALHFAKEAECIFLAGRSEERLLETQNLLLACNPLLKVQICCFDVGDEGACRQWCEEIFAHGLDVLILNAGMAQGKQSSAARHIAVCRTNALGVAHLAFCALERFRAQGEGNSMEGAQLVLLSSIASLAPLPNAPSYSASKYFVRILGECLALEGGGVRVSTICPGFIRTPLTDSIASFVPQMSLEYATQKIYRAIKRGKRLYIFPWWLAMLARFYALLPFCIKRLFNALLMRMGSL